MNLRQFFIGRSIGFLVLLAVLGLIAAFYAFNSYIYEEKQAYAAEDYKDAAYVIEGKRVQLMDGVAEEEAAPGSASKIVTRYFGNEVKTDLDGDGREDVVFLLTHQTGGSGTFYYVVAALNTERGYVGSEALLLGDRIAPQTTEVSRNPSHKGVIVVNYAVQAPGDPMTAQPSVGKSLWLKLDPQSMQFGEVAQDFEGEADPSRMTLDMKTWTWVTALLNDGSQYKPNRAGDFTLAFGKDGKFTATTDCNAMGGSYEANKESRTISFYDVYSTKKYCAGSMESKFQALLDQTNAYHFTSKGELMLDFQFDSGAMVFN